MVKHSLSMCLKYTFSLALYTKSNCNEEVEIVSYFEALEWLFLGALSAMAYFNYQCKWCETVLENTGFIQEQSKHCIYLKYFFLKKGDQSIQQHLPLDIL